MRLWLACAGVAVACAAQPAAPKRASAQTFDVKLPEVKQGSLEFGLDNSVQISLPRGANLNRSVHDQSLDYGLRDWWRLSGVLKLENPSESDFRVARTAVENLFVLKAVDDRRPTDIGIGWFTSVEASIHQDMANTFIFGPIVTLAAQKLSFTVNPFLERNFGRNSVEGIALTYGWQAKYEVRDGFAVGVEGFGVIETLGDPPPWSEQDHHVGPVLYTEIALGPNFKVTPDIGVLFGLTPATPSIAFKLNVGIPLHQQRRGN